jgi:maltose/moltooligosaccharide transporter
MVKKPRLSFWQIWNMSFGFLGIQFGFALQNGNASKILMTFGAEVDKLSLFWLVAPVTGMIVQPIIGLMSDKTWNRLGRRRPYFLTGAILTSIALILMPNAPHLATFIAPMFIGGGLLMIMDASINISMEPFRALVADKLPDEQHTLGFSVQTLLIGIGAVVGSWLPYILGNWMGVSKEASDGLVADNVTYSFYFGAFVLISSILWTIFTTSEYPPEELIKTAEIEEKPKKFFIPPVMIKLLLVQFFSWFALFAMWVYTTPAVALKYYGTADPNSQAFRDAGDWVGILFGVYNGVSAVIALSLPYIARRISKKGAHALALSIGGVSLFSFLIFSDPVYLIIPMIGIGIAWGSILAMPYAMLASSIPPKKMGVYMGLFNMSITIPQIVSGVFSGLILKYFFDGNPILCIVMAGISMFLGAVSALFIREKQV